MCVFVVHLDLRLRIMPRSSKKMKTSASYLVILLSLCLTMAMFGVSYAWEIGENRLINSGFEDDEVGQEPKEWALEKGG